MSDTERITRIVLMDDTGGQRGLVSRRKMAGITKWVASCDECEAESVASREAAFTGSATAMVGALLDHLDADVDRRRGVERGVAQ
jgi:hypothetical protein